MIRLVPSFKLKPNYIYSYCKWYCAHTSAGKNFEGGHACAKVEGVQKKCTNFVLHTTKMIDPRVKSQARGQRSRALK